MKFVGASIYPLVRAICSCYAVILAALQRRRKPDEVNDRVVKCRKRCGLYNMKHVLSTSVRRARLIATEYTPEAEELRGWWEH